MEIKFYLSYDCQRSRVEPGTTLCSGVLSYMRYGGWTYIMTNRAHGVLYVGVTSDIDRRIWEHRNGLGSKFCRKYGLDRLVLVEEHATIEDAIVREKKLKRWAREWKIVLIEASNPEWEDLGVRFC